MKSPELSKCCKASITIDSADEGTSCYVCDRCQKPCDLSIKMKEKTDFEMKTGKIFVRLGSQEIECTILSTAEYERLKHINQQFTHDLCCAVQDNERLIAENERLKRLDENVQKAIAEIKKERENPWETNANTSQLMEQLNILKGLYE